MRTTTWMILMLLLASVFHVAFNVRPVVAETRTIKVPEEYGTIQLAINNANPGDTIFVSANNTYRENLVVNKTISLIGKNVSNTVIDGRGVDNVIHVTANDVSLTGFTIRNSSSFSAGIYLDDSSNVTISGNIIMNNYFGFLFHNSTGNVVNGNTMINNLAYGIRLESSSNFNFLSGNIITNNTSSGIYVGGSLGNDINANLIANSTEGIMLSTARACKIYENIVTNNSYGVFSFSSNSSVFFRNNFINNTIDQVSLYNSIDNEWDNGAEGNYWSNHFGQDLNGDGVCDTAYEIDANNMDNFPLLEPWSQLRVFEVVWEGVTYKVVAFSNSTIARERSFSFDFRPYTRQIRFNVTGPSGQTGFFNLTVPKQLLAGNRWQVFVDGLNVTANAIVSENATHASLYLTYSFTTHMIEVLNAPERDIVPPVAEAGQDQTVRVGMAVTFNASGSYDPYGTIVSYKWDFGDGNVTTVADAILTHIYADLGTYVVTLTVEDAEGNHATDTATVFVQEAFPWWIVMVVVIVGGGVFLTATILYLRRKKNGRL